jgi:hypothetical protein
MRSPACEVRTRGVPGSEDLVRGLRSRTDPDLNEETMARVEGQVAVDFDKLLALPPVRPDAVSRVAARIGELL